MAFSHHTAFIGLLLNGMLPDGDPVRTNLTVMGEPFPTMNITPRILSVWSLFEPARKRLPTTSTEFMKKDGRFAKTIVFCVDQEHAIEMARALGNLNADLRVEHPDYVCRVTADEGDIGRGHLSRFQDVDSQFAGNPYYIAVTYDWCGRADLQECGSGARDWLHE